MGDKLKSFSELGGFTPLLISMTLILVETRVHAIALEMDIQSDPPRAATRRRLNRPLKEEENVR